MPTAELKRTIELLCPEIDSGFMQDFFARMDEEYFTTFSPEEICKHMRMSRDLDPAHTVRCMITPRGEGEFDIVIVGFDYLSEFSLICGLMSAFGLDIQSGNIYSFAKSSMRKRSSNRIVDVFTVRLNP